MLIIWSGYGWLVFVIIFVDTMIAELISWAITQDDGFFLNNDIPFASSLIISGIIINVLSKYFDKKKSEGKGTRVFDKITLAQESRFFFIRFYFWSYILVVWGAGLIVWQLIKR
jgi:hypothetical protein